MTTNGFLVVDLGGTTIETGYSPDGSSFDWTEKKPLSDSPSPDGWISWVLDKEPPAREAQWILGVPGPCQPEEVERTPNLEQAWEGSELVEALASASLDARFENDAHLAARGLYELPEAGDANPLLGVTLGTGIGGGIVVDGKLLRGTNGGAGEIGHMTLEAGGRSCTCGKSGCLEAYASARGLAETYRRNTGEDLTARELAERPTNEAEEAFRETGRYLGRGLALVANVLAPERILFAGGLSRSLDRFRDSMRTSFERNVFVPSVRDIPFRAPSPSVNPCLLGGLALSRTAGNQ